MRAPHTYSLSGSTSQGARLTATLSTSTGTPITSGSNTFDTSALTITVFSADALAATGVTTFWYWLGTVSPIVAFASADGSCTWTTASTALPTSANLGESGPYVTATRYVGCSPGNLPMTYWIPAGTVTSTWSYTDIGGIAFVCVNSSNRGSVGTSTESDCIEIMDIKGTLGSRARVSTKDLNGVTAVLSN